MTKKTLIALALVALAAVLIILRVLPDKQSVTAVQQGRGGAVNVKVHVIQPERLEDRIIITGSLLPSESVELRSEVSGKVTGIFFREGSHVSKGDLLLQINDSELQAQLERAFHQKELAAVSERRQRQQLEIEAVSQEAYETVLNRLNTLDAEIKLLQAQLQKTKVFAPFSGRIGLRYVSEGSFVSSNSVIAGLVDNDPIKIEFAIPERYAATVRNGLEIVFRVQGGSEKHRAVVYAIEPEIDTSTRSLHLRAQCPNPNGRFVPGSFAEVELLLNVSEVAVMAPTQTLIPELERQIIYLYRSGKAVPSQVEIGIRNTEKIEILSGAVPGDTVITSGILLLRPNLPVNIVDFE